MKKIISDSKINLFLILILLFWTLIYTLLSVPAGKYLEVTSLLKEIKVSAENENWKNANQQIKKLDQIWTNRTSYWLALNYGEEDNFALFDQNLNLLKNSIQFKNRQKTLERAKVLQSLWNNISRLFPRP